MESIERSQSLNGNGSTDRDTLMVLSGVALVVFGTGLILTSPFAKRLLGEVGIGSLAQAAVPDIERYLKLRNM